MMKNILNIYIYLHSRINRISYSEKIATLGSAFTFPNIFQKVQTNPLVFSEGTR